MGEGVVESGGWEREEEGGGGGPRGERDVGRVLDGSPEGGGAEGVLMHPSPPALVTFASP